MGTTESNTPTTKRENQKSDKTGFKQKSRIDCRGPPRAATSRLPSVRILSLFTALSHATGKQKLTGWVGNRGQGEPRRWTKARAVGLGCSFFAFFFFLFLVFLGRVVRGTPYLRKRRRAEGRGAFCDVVPVYRFVLCASVPVLRQPRRVSVMPGGVEKLLGLKVMGHGQAAVGSSQGMEVLSIPQGIAAGEDGSAEGSRLQITNCTMIASTTRLRMIRWVMRSEASEDAKLTCSLPPQASR